MTLDELLNPVPIEAEDPRLRPERACRDHEDPELFFPTFAAHVAAAIAVCDGCPIKALCGEFAAECREWGVWGGEYLENGIPVVKRAVGRPRKAPAANCGAA